MSPLPMRPSPPAVYSPFDKLILMPVIKPPGHPLTTAGDRRRLANRDGPPNTIRRAVGIPARRSETLMHPVKEGSQPRLVVAITPGARPANSVPPPAPHDGSVLLKAIDPRRSGRGPSLKGVLIVFIFCEEQVPLALLEHPD